MKVNANADPVGAVIDDMNFDRKIARWSALDFEHKQRLWKASKPDISRVPEIKEERSAGRFFIKWPNEECFEPAGGNRFPSARFYAIKQDDL